MARVDIASQTLPTDTNYSGASLTWTADNTAASGGNSTTSTGKELLLARNTSGSTAYTVTITSVADSLGRTRDMTLEIAASAYAMFGPFRQTGWMQTADSKLYFASTNAAIEFAVLKLPAI